MEQALRVLQDRAPRTVPARPYAQRCATAAETRNLFRGNDCVGKFDAQRGPTGKPLIGTQHRPRATENAGSNGQAGFGCHLEGAKG